MTVFAASLAAIAMLAGLAWLLGFRTRSRLSDAAAAERIADEALTGFRAAEAILDADGGAALLRGDDGRIVLVRAMGDRWVVRVLDAVRARQDGARLTLDLREAGARPTTLDLGPDAARWAALVA